MSKKSNKKKSYIHFVLTNDVADNGDNQLALIEVHSSFSDPHTLKSLLKKDKMFAEDRIIQIFSEFDISAYAVKEKICLEPL